MGEREDSCVDVLGVEEDIMLMALKDDTEESVE